MAYLVPSIDAEGIHVSTYDEILEFLIGKYKEIFGEDVYIGQETKDYQLLSIYAKCASDLSQLAVEDYNSRNPNYATGDSLDLLLPLVSMTRREATHSTVVLKLTGTEGTEIEAGSKVADENENIWVTYENAVIDSNGEATVSAYCEEAGSIVAPANTITEICDIADGWDGVTNESAATPGEDVETDAEVRARRKAKLATQNNGLYNAIYRAIIEIETVTFAALYVNDTGSTDANSIPAHSICAVVQGVGTSEETSEIAEAIWKAKAPGIGTYGSTSGTYNDSMGNVNVINFTRPSEAEVTVNISLNKLANYDDDRCSEIIKSTIENAINNLGVGKSWGVTTAYRDIYNAFANEDTPFILTSITGQTSAMGSASAVEVPCAYNKILKAGTITITANT